MDKHLIGLARCALHDSTPDAAVVCALHRRCVATAPRALSLYACCARCESVGMRRLFAITEAVYESLPQSVIKVIYWTIIDSTALNAGGPRTGHAQPTATAVAPAAKIAPWSGALCWQRGCVAGRASLCVFLRSGKP